MNNNEYSRFRQNVLPRRLSAEDIATRRVKSLGSRGHASNRDHEEWEDSSPSSHIAPVFIPAYRPKGTRLRLYVYTLLLIGAAFGICRWMGIL